MQLQTILNRVERNKSFVYQEPRWAADALRPTLEVPIRARAGSRPICSGCQRRRPGYDRLPPRRFEYVPLWQIHIMKQLGEAIDDVRAGEARRLRQDGYQPLLKHSRWCLLKRPENLTQQQTVKLAELLQYNLRSVRAYLHREDFQRFWQYQSPGWAGKFLDEWCARVMRSTPAGSFTWSMNRGRTTSSVSPMEHCRDTSKVGKRDS